MLKLIILMTFLALTSCRGIVSRGRNPVTERFYHKEPIEEIIEKKECGIPDYPFVEPEDEDEEGI